MNTAEVEDGSVAAHVVQPHPLSDPTLFEILKDERKVLVVLHRANGRSWKEIENLVGVDHSTVWLWRQQHPIDALVAQTAMDGAKSALLRLAARMDKAADVLCDHLEGKTTHDIDVERLRSAAAKTTLGVVFKLLEKAPGPDGKPQQPGAGKEIPTNELIRRAMEMRRLSKGSSK